MNIYGLTSVDMTDYVEHIGWYSIIDLVVLCAVFALIFVFFKKRNSIKLAIFTVSYILLYILVTFAGIYAEKWLGESGIGFMYITKRIMDFGAIFLIAAFAVVYQSDLKVIFSKISRTSEKSGHYEYETSDEDLTNSATQIVKACQNMAKNDVGALIIIVRTEVPSHILDTGTRLEAVVTSGLLESIFSTKGPLHDGAVVIKGERMLFAAVARGGHCQRVGHSSPRGNRYHRRERRACNRRQRGDGHHQHRRPRQDQEIYDSRQAV